MSDKSDILDESDILNQKSNMPNKDNCTSEYNGLYTDDKCHMCPRSTASSITPFMTPSGPTCSDIAPYQRTYKPEGGTTTDKNFLKRISYNTPTSIPANTTFAPSSVSFSCSSGELQNIGSINNPNYICNKKTDVISCNNNYDLLNIVTPSSSTYSCSDTLPLSCKTGDTLMNTGSESNPNYQCKTINCGSYGEFTSSGDMCSVRPYVVK